MCMFYCSYTFSVLILLGINKGTWCIKHLVPTTRVEFWRTLPNIEIYSLFEKKHLFSLAMSLSTFSEISYF